LQAWIFDIRSRPFVLLSASFIVVAILVHFDLTQQFDQNSILFFHDVAGNPSIDFLMQLVTEIGDVYYMVIFGIILVIIKPTRRIGVTIMILIVMSTVLAGYIKCGMDRDRPNLKFEGVPFPIPLEQDTFSLFCEGDYKASFPSGHVARAAVFGIVIGFSLSERFPRGCYLLLIYPLLMSISRVYVLQHYPMDVIGGALIGILLAGAVSQKTKLYKILKSEA